MSGIATFQVVQSSEELVFELLRAFQKKRHATFTATRFDDPRSNPETHIFVVYVEALYNGESQAFDLIDANHGWFRITLHENEPVRFDLII